MTDDIREGLQELIAKWRKGSYEGDDISYGLRTAADDLEEPLPGRCLGIKDTHLGVGVKMKPANPRRTLASKIRGVPQTAAHVEARAEKLRGGKRKDSKSGVPGVHWHHQNQAWRVQVRRVSGGCYEDFGDAVDARNLLAKAVFGPEAKQYRADGSLTTDN